MVSNVTLDDVLHNEQHDRNNQVLTRLMELQQTLGNDFINDLSEFLDSMLDDMQHQDFFGTEGQLDPRGDQREADWSMYRVQGIDAPSILADMDEDDDDDYL